MSFPTAAHTSSSYQKMDCICHFSWDWCSRPSCRTAFLESFSRTVYTRNKEVAMEWKPYGSFLATAPCTTAFRFCQVLFRIWYLIWQLDSDGRADLGKALSCHKTSLWRHSQYKKGGQEVVWEDNSKGSKDEAHQRKVVWQLWGSENVFYLISPCITIFSWLQ